MMNVGAPWPSSIEKPTPRYTAARAAMESSQAVLCRSMNAETCPRFKVGPRPSACQTVKLALSLALWPLNWQLTVCVPVPLVVRVVVR